MKNDVLIATNGFEGTWPAVEYGAWVAEVTSAPAVLLAVSESHGPADRAQPPSLDDHIARATELFRSRGVEFAVQRSQGKSEEIVAQVARQVGGLTVVGPLGRPFLQRLLVGRSIRTLLESIVSPVLYVPHACLPMKKLLICVGGLGYEITAEHLAIRLGSAAGAVATLLHVAPPVDFDYPTARVERDHWRDLISTDSLLGRNLRQGLEVARSAGMTASVKARQGDVVEEIAAEIKTGSYDLICMGSPHGFGGLRHLSEPNVTDEIAEHAYCPVLTARYAPQPTT